MWQFAIKHSLGLTIGKDQLIAFRNEVEGKHAFFLFKTVALVIRDWSINQFAHALYMYCIMLMPL
jgi:hypothetical protein